MTMAPSSERPSGRRAHAANAVRRPLSHALTFLPSIPDSRSFDTKTGTTTPGCGGGCSKVRLEGPNWRREKSLLAVLFDRMKKTATRPLFSLSRHNPSPRATPSRASFCPSFAKKAPLSFARYFASKLRRNRALQGWLRKSANPGQRAN